MVCLAALVPWAGGCSLIFVEPTPRDHEQRATVLCTSNYTAPVLDSVLTGLLAVSVLSQAGAEGDEDERLSGGALVAPAAFGILTAASAIYGYATVPQCREAREELTVRVQQEQQALQRYRRAKLSQPAAPAQLPPAPPTPEAPTESDPDAVHP